MAAGLMARWALPILASLVALTALGACNAQPPASEPPDLRGRWAVLTIDGSRPVGEVWVDFTATRLSGSSGCNQFSADYSRTDDQLSIGTIAGTKRFCPDDALMAQEDRVLDILSATSDITQDQGQLTIRSKAGSLVMEPTEAASQD